MVFAFQANYAAQQVIAEAVTRQNADGQLQEQINRSNPFSTEEATTLRELASVLTVTPTRLTLARDLFVNSDLAVTPGHTLLLNRVLPINHNWLPAPAGVTMFLGDVGISRTNTLFLDTIAPIDPEPFNRSECVLTIGDGLLNGSLPPGGGCRETGLPTVFLSPVMIRR